MDGVQQGDQGGDLVQRDIDRVQVCFLLESNQDIEIIVQWECLFRVLPTVSQTH